MGHPLRPIKISMAYAMSYLYMLILYKIHYFYLKNSYYLNLKTSHMQNIAYQDVISSLKSISKNCLLL